MRVSRARTVIWAGRRSPTGRSPPSSSAAGRWWRCSGAATPSRCVRCSRAFRWWPARTPARSPRTAGSSGRARSPGSTPCWPSVARHPLTGAARPDPAPVRFRRPPGRRFRSCSSVLLLGSAGPPAGASGPACEAYASQPLSTTDTPVSCSAATGVPADTWTSISTPLTAVVISASVAPPGPAEGHGHVVSLALRVQARQLRSAHSVTLQCGVVSDVVVHGDLRGVALLGGAAADEELLRAEVGSGRGRGPHPEAGQRDQRHGCCLPGLPAVHDPPRGSWTSPAVPLRTGRGCLRGRRRTPRSGLGAAVDSRALSAQHCEGAGPPPPGAVSSDPDNDSLG